MHFSRDVQRNSCFEHFKDSQKNIFGKVLLSSSNFFKTSCGETTNKVACEIFALYKFEKLPSVLKHKKDSNMDVLLGS